MYATHLIDDATNCCSTLRLPPSPPIKTLPVSLKTRSWPSCWWSRRETNKRKEGGGGHGFVSCDVHVNWHSCMREGILWDIMRWPGGKTIYWQGKDVCHPTLQNWLAVRLDWLVDRGKDFTGWLLERELRAANQTVQTKGFPCCSSK